MASRMTVIGNPDLTFIYNVSQHVGPGKPNLADDVELVQFFISEGLKKPNPSRRITGPAPAITRTFDLVTGFWLYEYEWMMHEGGQAIIDGVVSPAHGTSISYMAGKFWLIGALNYGYHADHPAEFADLYLDMRLSATLRSSIAP